MSVQLSGFSTQIIYLGLVFRQTRTIGICLAKRYSPEKEGISPENSNGWFRCISYWNMFDPFYGVDMLVLGGVKYQGTEV